jgi:hypothetical protein
MKRPCVQCGKRPAAYAVTEFCSIECQYASFRGEQPAQSKERAKSK